MDSLIGLIISVSISIAGGIATAVKQYKEKKSRKKLKKRLAELERQVERGVYQTTSILSIRHQDLSLALRSQCRFVDLRVVGKQLSLN